MGGPVALRLAVPLCYCMVLQYVQLSKSRSVPKSVPSHSFISSFHHNTLGPLVGHAIARERILEPQKEGPEISQRRLIFFRGEVKLFFCLFIIDCEP